MKNILGNPSLGKPIISSVSDPRWLGWTKMQYSVTSEKGVQAVIHYVAKYDNGILKAVDDYKFVNK